MTWNKRDKVWGSTNSLFKWSFCSCRRRCCLKLLLHLKYRKFLTIRDYCVSTFPNPQSFVPDAILTCSKLAAKLTSLIIKIWVSILRQFGKKRSLRWSCFCLVMRRSGQDGRGKKTANLVWQVTSMTIILFEITFCQTSLSFKQIFFVKTRKH